MHLFQKIKEALLESIAAMQQSGALSASLTLDAITVEPPRDANHGDMSTNAAMVLAGQAKANPRALAEQFATALRELPDVTEVAIAGPGFINLRFAPAFWQREMLAILSAGASYGDSAVGGGTKVNVEYVSANPTGPLHVGHARGAIYGDALAILLKKAGYDVTKEYYINDAGAQVDVLARSAYLRYREACGQDIGEIPQGLYPGDYLVATGAALKEAYGETLLKKDESEWLADVKRFAIDAMMALIKQDLAALNIFHDVFVSEQSLHDAGAIPKAIENLKTKGLIYRGVLEPPKGKKPEGWEEREQLLFKSTDFGDDSDRALQKPDDSYTYFAADLAYAQDKINRGYAVLVYMLGADHGGYKKRMEAAVSALSGGTSVADIKLCQLVHLFQNGEPFKMSKRAGTFITVRDVYEAVGRDILRFVMLTRKSDMAMDFDLEKVKEQSKDNPVFYVQYAHARCCSLRRIAAEQMPEALALSVDEALLAQLSTEVEMAVIRALAHFPRMIEQAAQANEPHRVAYYLQELAGLFHGLWNQGQGSEQLRFLVPGNTQLTAARLALAASVAAVVASGLQVLGVEPAHEL